MTPQEMSVNFDGAAAARTEFPMFFPMQPTLKKQAQSVLFNEKHAQEVLPDLEVVYIFCTQTQWYCAWGMVETEKQYKENIAQGKKVRPIRFIGIEGANHFVSRFSWRLGGFFFVNCCRRFIGTIRKNFGQQPWTASITKIMISLRIYYWVM